MGLESLRNLVGDSNSGILGNAKDAAIGSAAKQLEDANILPPGILGRTVPAQVQADVIPAVSRASDGPRSDYGNVTQSDLGTRGSIGEWIAANKKTLVVAGVVAVALVALGVIKLRKG